MKKVIKLNKWEILWQAYNKGESRIIEKFAWFPIQIGQEQRWLEKVKYLEIASMGDFIYWKKIRFIED